MSITYSEIEVETVFRGLSTPTYRIAVDPWGFSLNLRKSDFQKAIRRGNFKQALVAFFTCYNTLKLYPDNSSAKAIRTNIINRVVICAMEDVGVADIPLVMKVVTYMDLVATKKKTTSDIRIARLIYSMCKARKTRVQSHLHNVFLPVKAHLWEAAGIVKGDSEIFDLRKTNPVAFWARYSDKYPVLNRVCKRMGVKNKGAVSCFVATIEYFIERKMIDPDVLTERPLIRKIPTKYEVLSVFTNHFKMDPATCAYDKHTLEGRGMGTAQFRNEGAFVKRESRLFAIPAFKYIYENLHATPEEVAKLV
jgi:hypothetical protein